MFTFASLTFRNKDCANCWKIIFHCNTVLDLTKEINELVNPGVYWSSLCIYLLSWEDFIDINCCCKVQHYLTFLSSTEFYDRTNRNACRKNFSPVLRHYGKVIQQFNDHINSSIQILNFIFHRWPKLWTLIKKRNGKQQSRL